MNKKFFTIVYDFSIFDIKTERFIRRLCVVYNRHKFPNSKFLSSFEKILTDKNVTLSRSISHERMTIFHDIALYGDDEWKRENYDDYR